MPHSSGGGSFGGGFHGGSHGGGLSGSSYTIYRRSRSYFPGAVCYVYYRNSHPHYVYASGDIRAEDQKKNRRRTLLFTIPFVIFLAVAMVLVCAKPSRIGGRGHYETVIADNISVLGDTTRLQTALTEFKDKTGITPYILTVDNSVWKRYASLEGYAYDAYVDHFSYDETGWTIVYSETSGDFYWEGMQGDETDGILSERKLKKFNSTMQSGLKDPTVSVGDAMAQAFETLNPVVMDREIEWVALVIIGLFMVIVVGLDVSLLFGDKIRGYSTEELTQVKMKESEQAPKTVTCAYCGGEYVIGVHERCPHCGATVEDNNF